MNGYFYKMFLKIFRRHVKMEGRVKIDSNCMIKGDVLIGRGTHIRWNIQILGNIKIGRYCAIGNGAVMREKNHDYGLPSIDGTVYKNFLKMSAHHISKGPIIIGNDVWIGTLVTMSGLEQEQLYSQE